MKGSLTILGFFVAGVLLGRYGGIGSVAGGIDGTQAATYVLYVLMFTVGVAIGSDSKSLGAIAEHKLRLLILPLGTIIGTLSGVVLVAWAISGYSLSECLAVGAGMGYYSLSSVIITGVKGVELGTIALMSNIIREILTLTLAPLMVRGFSPLGLIAAGGATTIDTTLPVIVRFSGKDFIFVSVAHGMAVDFSVPVLVTLFSTF